MFLGNNFKRNFTLKNKQTLFNYIKRTDFSLKNFYKPENIEHTCMQKKGRLFGKMKKYGKFGIIFYSAYIWVAYFTFYALLRYKIVKLDRIIEMSEKYGINKYIDIRKKVESYPTFSNVVVAYLMNQIFEVIRFPTTILFLTYYVRKFRK